MFRLSLFFFSNSTNSLTTFFKYDKIFQHWRILESDMHIYLGIYLYWTSFITSMYEVKLLLLLFLSFTAFLILQIYIQQNKTTDLFIKGSIQSQINITTFRDMIFPFLFLVQVIFLSSCIAWNVVLKSFAKWCTFLHKEIKDL